MKNEYIDYLNNYMAEEAITIRITSIKKFIANELDKTTLRPLTKEMIRREYLILETLNNLLEIECTYENYKNFMQQLRALEFYTDYQKMIVRGREISHYKYMLRKYREPLVVQA